MTTTKMGKNKTAPLDIVDSPRALNGPSSVDSPPENYGEKYKFDPDFQGPVRNRSCTDVICLALFLVFLGGWGFVAYIGISNGDIDKVIFSRKKKLQSCHFMDLTFKHFLLNKVFLNIRCNSIGPASTFENPNVCN